MMDTVTPAKRSQMMSCIKGRHTRPEMQVRSWLHARGFRFRLYRKDLPGTPDIVLARYRVAVFVHGCFWHRHSGCRFATNPGTRVEFWQQKFSGNVARDHRDRQLLLDTGWRVLIIWECGLRQRQDLDPILGWLRGEEGACFEWPQMPFQSA